MLLSVRLQTYNHQADIEQALQSIETQITDFDFEVVIGDDFSTDNNLHIIKKFISNSKNKKIAYNLLERHRGDLYWEKRQTEGRLYNFVNIIENCSGKYIALLDGDDYWTDPLKLQKQVDFLEANPDYGICFHNVLQINTLDETTKMIIPNVETDTDFSINDYILANKTATCSIVFRKENYRLELTDWFYSLPFGDLAVVLEVMKNTNEKGRVLKDTMGIYRIHENGLHGVFHKSKKGLIKAYEQHLKFTKIISSYLLFEKRYEKTLFLKKRNTVLKLMNLSKEEKIYLKFINYKVLLLFYQFKSRFLNL